MVTSKFQHFTQNLIIIDNLLHLDLDLERS